MADLQSLLGALPPYNAEELIIVRAQDVPDIMEEVVEAHKFFAPDYDTIVRFFWNGDVYDTCELLWKFLKNNVAYVVEPNRSQTTKSPSAILTDLHGDCKHYAGFIAGVLDGINRAYNEDIKWKYCFANYDPKTELPQHVFVKVKDGSRDIWIDPVLNSFDDHLQPVNCIHKKVSMLSRISGINDSLYDVGYQSNSIGTTWGGVVDIALDFVSNLFDKVPNYPVKETGTFNSLKASLMEHVGTVAPQGQFQVVPQSLQQAQEMLAKAKKRKAEEIALGHGYGDGPGWDTLQMLYDETIRALELLIAKGQELTAGVTDPGPIIVDAPDVPTAQGDKNLKIALVAAAGLGLFFLTRKKKRVSGIKSNKTLLIGGGLILALVLMKKKSSPGIAEGEPVTSELPATDVINDTAIIKKDVDLPGSPYAPPLSKQEYMDSVFTVSSYPAEYTRKTGYSEPSLITAMQTAFDNQYN